MRPPSFRPLAPAVLLLAVMAAAASAAPIKDRDEAGTVPFVLWLMRSRFNEGPVSEPAGASTSA